MDYSISFKGTKGMIDKGWKEKSSEGFEVQVSISAVVGKTELEGLLEELETVVKKYHIEQPMV
jgi:hypothetical protein